MNTRTAFIVAACLCIAAFSPSISQAASMKSPPDKATAAEQPFVARATAELQRLYGTTALASKAGYFRYNNEDRTGAISWIDTNYWTSDETHPSQLWYDVKGRLIGVDYAQPWTDSKHPPQKWGIIPARWFEFEPHVHYALRMPNGSLKYGGFRRSTLAKYGDPDNPTAAAVVKALNAKAGSKPIKESDVAFVFPFKHVWDLEFWLVPNPNGAFAEANPNVKPSHSMSGGM